MRNFTPFLCSILLILASCTKEKSIDTIGITPGGSSGNGNGGGSGGGNNSGGSEVGTWKFISSHAITSQTLEMTLGGDIMKTVTTSDYTTENNAGTVTFDGTTMTTNGVAYSVNSTANVAFYTNGVLDNSQTMPFVGTIPPTNSSVGYKKIGADSLYFSAGVMTGLNSSGSVETRPAGYKLKFEGDKMYMTLVFDETKLDLSGGIGQKIITKVTNVSTLQKQ